MNTFLLTYRVFTDSETVLNALKKVFYDPPTDDDQCDCDNHTDYLDIPGGEDCQYSLRRTSGASSVSGIVDNVFSISIYPKTRNFP